MNGNFYFTADQGVMLLESAFLGGQQLCCRAMKGGWNVTARAQDEQRTFRSVNLVFEVHMGRYIHKQMECEEVSRLSWIKTAFVVAALSCSWWAY
jgi:hypothetical protein